MRGFFAVLPKWYRAWLVVLILWALFVGAEDVWQHATGHPLWPVSN